MTVLSPDFWVSALGVEFLWMLFPVAGVLALAGLAFAAWRRSKGDKLVLVLVGVFLGYYILLHFHSYYMLPMTPFLALAIAAVTVDAFSRHYRARAARIVLVVSLVACMTLFSLVMLGGQKWGRWSPVAIRESYGSLGEPVIGNRLADFFGPTVGIVDRTWKTPVLTATQYAALPATTTLGLFVAPGPSTARRGARCRRRRS